MGAVVEIDFRRDPIRIHLLVHALHCGIFIVVEDNVQSRQLVIARRAEAAERRIVEEHAAQSFCYFAGRIPSASG